MAKQYAAIDLKSFYASAECVELGLDPLDAFLVVADESRTEKTICLAVSPALKSFGIPGRARLFEVLEKVRQVNEARRLKAPGRKLTGSARSLSELNRDPSLSLDPRIAPPRMSRYMEISAKVYGIYCRHISPDDIHVYSIDEVFIDLTPYLKYGGLTARKLTMTLIREVLKETGITATAGIGPNLYLCKIAMDITAKHIPADADGVRIAELDEMTYRRELWDHTPLTDFWRVGPGTVRRLQSHGMYTMGDVARCSLGPPGTPFSEDLLYKIFGVNAGLLIDHAWGWEPCTIADIKAYRPESVSLSSGQVLTKPYPWRDTRVVIREMADQMALNLLEKGLCTDLLALDLNYDRECLLDPAVASLYKGEVENDRYGRPVPKPAHGSVRLDRPTSSARLIANAVMELFDRITDDRLLFRRLNLSACELITEEEAKKALSEKQPEQLDLFTDWEALDRQRQREEKELAKEKAMQQTVLALKQKFGKNAVLRAMSLSEGATARQRNEQIGGHKAGLPDPEAPPKPDETV